MSTENYLSNLMRTLVLLLGTLGLLAAPAYGSPKFVKADPPREKVSSEALAIDEGSAQKSTDQKISLKSQLAKLRGKMLYKRNQVRKAEELSLATNPELRAKAKQLDQERRLLFIADNPDIRQLYQELDILTAEVEKFRKE